MRRCGNLRVVDVLQVEGDGEGDDCEEGEDDAEDPDVVLLRLAGDLVDIHAEDSGSKGGGQEQQAEEGNEAGVACDLGRGGELFDVG